jgi:hypothetical protein
LSKKTALLLILRSVIGWARRLAYWVPNLLGLASLQNNFKVSVFVPANKKLEALIKMAEMISIALSR